MRKVVRIIRFLAVVVDVVTIAIIGSMLRDRWIVEVSPSFFRFVQENGLRFAALVFLVGMLFFYVSRLLKDEVA